MNEEGAGILGGGGATMLREQLLVAAVLAESTTLPV